MTILRGNKRFVEFQFKLEDDFEELIRAKSKAIFGERTIFVDIKRKLTGDLMGDGIPDGFLFDLTDIENPEFYLVEVELQNHDFAKHIFPQISRFFAFFPSLANPNDLVEKLYYSIHADPEVKREFKKVLGNKETFKFLKDICEESQNILLVIDGDKKELQDAIHPYADIWRERVKILTVKKFTNGNESLILVEGDMKSKTEKREKKSSRQQYKGQGKMAFIKERMTAKGSARMTKSTLVALVLKTFPGSNEKTTRNTINWIAYSPRGLKAEGKTSTLLR